MTKKNVEQCKNRKNWLVKKPLFESEVQSNSAAFSVDRLPAIGPKIIDTKITIFRFFSQNGNGGRRSRHGSDR